MVADPEALRDLFQALARRQMSGHFGFSGRDAKFLGENFRYRNNL
jgi:hypothetical protein